MKKALEELEKAHVIELAALAEAVRVEGWGGREALAVFEDKARRINTLIASMPGAVAPYLMGHIRHSVAAHFSGHGLKTLYFNGGEGDVVAREVAGGALLRFDYDHPISHHHRRLVVGGKALAAIREVIE